MMLKKILLLSITTTLVATGSLTARVWANSLNVGLSSVSEAKVGDDVDLNINVSSPVRGAATVRLRVEGPGKLSQTVVSFEEITNKSRSVTVQPTGSGEIRVYAQVDDAYNLDEKPLSKPLITPITIVAKEKQDKIVLLDEGKITSTPKEEKKTVTPPPAPSKVNTPKPTNNTTQNTAKTVRKTNETVKKTIEKPASTAPVYKPPVKTDNVELKSLTVSGGKLRPDFNKLVHNYTVDVEEKVNEVSVTAVPMDPSSKVRGLEKVVFKEKETSKELKITVLAANGATSEYKITFLKGGKPSAFLDFTMQDGSAKKFRFLNAIPEKSVELPTSFQKKEIEFQGEKVNIFVHENNQEGFLAYLEAEDETFGLYFYNHNSERLLKINPVKINEQFYGFVDVEDLKFPHSTLVDTTVENFSIKAIKLNQGNGSQGFLVLKALTFKGDFSLVYYDVEQNFVGAFMNNQNFISKLMKEKEALQDSNKNFILFLIISVVFSVLLVIFMLYIVISYKKKQESELG